MTRIFIIIALILPTFLTAQVTGKTWNKGIQLTAGSSTVTYSRSDRTVNQEVDTGEQENFHLGIHAGYPIGKNTYLGLGVGMTRLVNTYENGGALTQFTNRAPAEDQIAPGNIRLLEATVNSSGINIPIFIEYDFQKKNKNRDGLRMRVGVRNQFFTGHRFSFEAQQPRERIFDGSELNAPLGWLLLPFIVGDAIAGDEKPINLSSTDYYEDVSQHYADRQRSYAADIFLQVDIPLFTRTLQDHFAFTIAYHHTVRPVSSLVGRSNGATFGLTIQF
ncbi:MAG: outer membrane beta-barrel protein [Bacteroidota bacterium]